MNIKGKEPTMHAEAPQARLFARRPFFAFGKLSVASLLAASVISGILAITIGYPANTALLIVTGGLLAGAGLATIRFRWRLSLITLLSGLFLYQLLRAPFVLYHLTNPKGNGFFFFLMDVLIIAFTIITLGASIGAVVQNYHWGGATRFWPSANCSDGTGRRGNGNASRRHLHWSSRTTRTIRRSVYQYNLYYRCTQRYI